MKPIKLSSLFLVLGLLGCKSQQLATQALMPDGFIVQDTIKGDLNKDGREDLVLLIKGTDTTKVVTNRFGKLVDRNRRGVLVGLDTNNSYQLISENLDCFVSENEDGGVYFPPQLSISIEDGDLNLHFSHGRYGYWSYSFRHRDSGMELIAYKEVAGGALIQSITKIDFLGQTKVDSLNIADDSYTDEVFEDHQKRINVDQLLKLSEIKAFEDLDLKGY